MPTKLLDTLLRSAAVIALFTAPAMAQSDTSAEPTEEEAASSETDDEMLVLETIVVTGTSLRGVKPTGSSMITVNREMIEVAGITTTSELLSHIPQTTQFNRLRTATTSVGPGVDVPNLRGIGLGGTATLTVLNGRRMVGTGVLQTIPEPSAIPPLALERVEVLVDGASAIYGSDAIAGVINLIPRRDFEGVETNFRAGFADAYQEWNAGAVLGEAWDGGSAMIAYEFNTHDNISGADRDFVTNDRSAFGDPDERSTSCPDANIRAGGVEVVPGFFVGEVTFAGPDFAPNTLNRCDTTDWKDILNADERHSVFGAVRQEVSSSIELYLEGYYSQRHTEFRQTQDAFNFTMPITNPFFIDPTGTGLTSVRVNYRFNDEFGDSQLDETDLRSGGITLGSIIQLGGDWVLDAYANFGWGKTETFEQGINQLAAFTAVFGFTPDTAFDPFGGNTNPAVLDAIGDFATDSQSSQSMRAFVAKVDGPLAQLPAGEVRLAVGAQTHHEDIDAERITGPEGAPTFSGFGEEDRTINSVYAEMLVPIFGEDNAVPGFKSLNISAAIRHDDYSDVGGTTNPKFGLDWEPVEGFNLRATWGTAFHAPQTTDIGDPTVDARLQMVPSLPSFLTPPGVGDLNALFIAGGNTELTPEEATTYTVGFDWRPKAIEGLSLSATYYDVAFKNGISIPVDGSGRIYSIPSLSRFYTLNPTDEEIQFWLDRLPLEGILIPPVQLILDARRHNLEQQNQTGLEFQISHLFGAFGGDMMINLDGNYILKSEIQAAPGEEFISNKENRIDFSTRASVLWFKDQYRVGVVTRYTGPSNNTTVMPSETIDSFTKVDLNFGYTIEGIDFLDGVELSLNIDNVFDAEPPYFNGGDGIANGHPMGRKVSIGLRKVW